MNWIAYFTIGIIISACGNWRFAIQKPEDWKENIQDWAWWAASVVCAIGWPIVLANAIYKAFCKDT